MIFEGGARWLPPERGMKFEYTTRMDEFVSDEDYNSSEEESEPEDDRRNLGGAPPGDGLGGGNEGQGYLNPLQMAKLTHLLARLPTTHAKLRRGDVVRITAFAIEHAGAGAEEIVEMIISNIMNPLACTGANPDRDLEAGDGTTEDNQAQDSQPTKENIDPSAAKLVGLYIISDILSSSATSGVRHSWRYRQLFESALKSHQVFEHLGRLEKDLKWGRLKAEKWKRSVGNLLHMWEGWCVFPQSSQEHFMRVFEKPPLTEEELREETEKANAERAASAFSKGKSRWKTVDEDEAARKFDPSRPPVDRMDTAPSIEENLDGEPMSDIDGVPMEDSDLEDPDGEPMEEERPDEETKQDEQTKQEEEGEQSQSFPRSPDPQRPVRKPRPKAEDMFADSDSEEA